MRRRAALKRPRARSRRIRINRTRILAIATSADGNLGVLEEYYPQPSSNRCRLTVEPANANGKPVALAEIDCTNSYANEYGYALARNPILPSASPNVPAGDAFDVLASQDATGNESIHRYDETGNLLSTLTLPNSSYRAIADDKGGHAYVDDTAGNVAEYKATSADGGSTSTVATLATSRPAPAARSRCPRST